MKLRFKNVMAATQMTKLLLIVVLLQTVACHRAEIPTSISVENGPLFSFQGSGRLASFTISAPLTGQKIAEGCTTRLFPCAGRATPVWQIEAAGGYFQGEKVSGLQLRYGSVPEGYTQLVPAKSQGVPPLTSGMVYAFFAETTEAPAFAGNFYVEPSGTIDVVDISDLCKRLKDGEWVRVNCKTDQPYEEPSDIEKFVREHRKSQ